MIMYLSQNRWYTLNHMKYLTGCSMNYALYPIIYNLQVNNASICNKNSHFHSRKENDCSVDQMFEIIKHAVYIHNIGTICSVAYVHYAPLI